MPRDVSRLLLLADHVHPFIYRQGFPEGLPDVDVVLAAGDLPGYYLEFIATQLPAPLVYVHGNHQDEYLLDDDGQAQLPSGVIAAHGRLVRVAGLTVAGWGGVPRYREGEGQYLPGEARWGLRRLSWQLGWQRRTLDIVLTHAPPAGLHAGSDRAHRGCEELTRFMHRHRPPLLVHGHIHEYEGKKSEYVDPVSGTRVVNAYGYRLLEFRPEDRNAAGD